MKLRVSFEIEHKDLSKLQEIITKTNGLAVVGDLSPASPGTTASPAPTTVTKPAVEKPAVEKPAECTPDEIRAAMLAYSKVKSTDEALAVLKEVGKSSKIKNVDAANYPALLEAFAV